MNCPTCSRSLLFLCEDCTTPIRWCGNCGTVTWGNDNSTENEVPDLVSCCRGMVHNGDLCAHDQWVIADHVYGKTKTKEGV